MIGAIALVAVGSMAAVAVAHDGSPSVSGAKDSAPLPNDQGIHSATTKCTGGTSVVGGGIRFTDPVNDYHEGSYPKGSNSWKTVAYGGLGAPSDATNTAYARCLKGANVIVKSNS